jgi:hypothetical protein
MVDVNIRSTFSFHNSVIRMDGLLKPAEGEYAAQVYVIYAKIKKKILSMDYASNTNEDLINKIDKWNNVRCFLFQEKYIEKNDWQTINAYQLRQAILNIHNINLSKLKNSI